MKDLNDFLPPRGVSQLTDGEALDILYDIDNQDEISVQDKYEMMSSFLYLLANNGADAE